ncbi:E3 ubiquitin-protein ligase SH3RF2-like isoform X1 [Chiloscyllium plagiosum]|uniref:E3 ubiquitin-protein ligase SH3RF2-like isoform X1 n=1 Tax=Chiloscyllium plagiosum TaxID=36176 RepID=UPI001CB8047F|nr:E3 ubiquitin-protein ligase SH3RF2-like isoform X1 [Chiloscyllium plagiosum]XP_043559186.1 E3 ubiquitin-protein ligase SH3RF2-like isoform X1 [Chiloscyllium plagiosum]
MTWYCGSRMDDLALLDLLECPVCFERLDATAKVLPCQHTFCKPCLQRIFNARKELRCPECRTPVTCSIEELPVNLLLVRLLDGIKYGQSNVRITPDRLPQTPSNQEHGQRSTDTRGLQASLVNAAKSPIEKVPCARALYTYGGQKPGDLSFKKGDVILLRRQVDENWYYGEINGVCGIFPLNFVQVIHHLPQPPPLCKALYDFNLKEKDKEANKDLLPFLKNDILKVIRRVDENWVEGKLGDKVGIFPISFVEMNSTAKQLLAIKRPDGKDGKCQGSVAVTNSSTAIKRTETGRVAAKDTRHTSAMNILNRISHPSPSTQPLQISSPVLISSSNPAVVAQIAERRSPSSPTSKIKHNPSEAGVASSGIIDANSSFNTEILRTKPQVPVRSEEQIGDMFPVYGMSSDGWIRGMSMQVNKAESLPCSYNESSRRNTCRLPDQRGLDGLLASANAQERGTASEASLNLQASPSGRQVAVTSPPVPSGATIARHIPGSSYRVNVHRPIVAVPPVQSQSTSSRCVPAVVIQAQPFASHQFLHPVTIHAAHCNGLLGAGRSNLSNRPIANTAPIICHNRKPSAMQDDEASNCTTVDQGCVPMSDPTPSHCKAEDRSRVHKTQPSLGTFPPHCVASSTRPKFQLTSVCSPTPISFKPEQVTAQSVLQETSSPPVPVISHNRAGSCPIGSEEEVQTTHRKTGSWDSCYRCIPPSPLHSPVSEGCPKTLQNRSMCFNRCRAVLSYPAQGDAELGLEQGDIVLVHRKHQDGWFQGTHTESGKTGLFPGSFVESLQ